MRVRVNVREAQFTIACGDGDQTFKWLGFTAAYKYARQHGFAHHPDSWLPVNVTDPRTNILFPDEAINSRCKDGAEVNVELLAVKGQLADQSMERERPLWELYATTNESDWVSVVFRYDASGLELDQPPRVTGNFTGWTYALEMKKAAPDSEEYQLVKLFPPQADIVFKFIVDGNEEVSEMYDIVLGQNQREMNYFQVRALLPDYSGLQPAEPTADYAAPNRAKSVNRVVSQRVVGAFSSVRDVNDDMRGKMFELDWAKMQFADVVRLKAKRLEVQKVFLKHYDLLRNAFQYFSSHGGGAITHMSVMEFIYFCHVCKVPSKRLTMTVIDGVFHRVNIDEVFDEEAIEKNPDEYRNAMRIVPDPFNPKNQFIRGEFMEAILRLAVIKHRNLDPEDALDRFVKEHIVQFASGTVSTMADIRQQLLEPAVQRVYRKYAKRLHHLYKQTAALDKSDQDRNTINLKEFELLLVQNNLIDRDLSRRAAFAAFAMSQDATLEDSQNYEMVYPEFLEVLGRIAEAKYTDNRPLHEKISTLFGLLLSDM